MDGLVPIAEVIENKKVQKPTSDKLFEEDTDSAGEEIEEDPESKDLNPRKLAKKQMKAERREKRKQKKELKMAFKNQHAIIKDMQTVKTAGEIRPGVSVRKIE